MKKLVVMSDSGDDEDGRTSCWSSPAGLFKDVEGRTINGNSFSDQENRKNLLDLIKTTRNSNGRKSSHSPLHGWRHSLSQLELSEQRDVPYVRNEPVTLLLHYTPSSTPTRSSQQRKGDTVEELEDSPRPISQGHESFFTSFAIPQLHPLPPESPVSAASGIGIPVLSSWEASCEQLIINAVPSGVAMVLNQLIQFVSLTYVGQELGHYGIAAHSIGYFFLSVLILFPSIGMTFACDTLFSQTLGRDPSCVREIAEILSRSLFISCLLLVILTVLLLYSRDFIIVPLYGPGRLANGISEWLSYSPLYLWTTVLSHSYRKLACSLLKPQLVTWPLAAGVLTVLLVGRPMVRYFGLAGASMASGIGMSAMFISMIYVLRRDPVVGPRLERCAVPHKSVVCAWPKMVQYLRLGIPSAIFVTAESSSFDISGIIAGQLDSVSAAAWSILLHTTVLFFSFTVGVSTAASALVGRAIGQSREHQARRYALLAVLLALGFSSCSSLLFVTFYTFTFGMTSPGELVLEKIHAILWLLPLFHILDCVQIAFQGIFSAAGLNHVGATVLLLTLNFVGLPLAWALGLRKFDSSSTASSFASVHTENHTVTASPHILQHLFSFAFQTAWLQHFSGIAGICAGLTVGLCLEVPILLALVCFAFDWKPMIRAH